MKRMKAFTLVELLVVVGVIALLISMLMPALRKARAAAYGVMCGSNLRQVYLAEQFYANDFHGWIGYTNIWNGTYGNWNSFLLGGDDPGPGGVPGYDINSIYVKDPNILGCPAWEPAKYVKGGPSRLYGFNADAIADIRFPMPPDLPQRQFVPYVIGYRSQAEVPVPWDPYEFNVHTGMIRFLNMARARHPATGVMFADSLFPNIWMAGSSELTQPETIRLTGWEQGEFGWYGRAIHLRHNNRANLMFWDGHIEAYDAKGLAGLGGAAWVTQDLKKYP